MLAIMLGRGDATAPLPSLPLLSSGPAGAAPGARARRRVVCCGMSVGARVWRLCWSLCLFDYLSRRLSVSFKYRRWKGLPEPSWQKKVAANVDASWFLDSVALAFS